MLELEAEKAPPLRVVREGAAARVEEMSPWILGRCGAKRVMPHILVELLM
jgi:hypothetical protein